MDTLQVSHFDSLDIDETILLPEADLSELMIPRCNPQGDGLVGGDTPHVELEVVQRDSAIRIRGALNAKAEQILGRLEGWREDEGAEQGLLSLQGLLEAPIRDLTRR